MKSSNRSVKPECEKIKQLRLSRGWRVEDLAMKAECSERTIISIEKCKEAYPFTISKIASAFGINADEIIVGSTPAPVTSLERRFKVSVTIEGNIEDFDESSNLSALLSLLEKLCNLRGIVVPVEVRPGNSVVIVMEMDESDALRLLNANDGGIFAGSIIENAIAMIRLRCMICGAVDLYAIDSQQEYSGFLSNRANLSCSTCGYRALAFP